MKKYICSLLSMLVLSSLIVACGGACIKYDILQPMGLYQEKSIMELPFLLVTDDALRYMMKQHAQATEPAQPDDPPATVATEPEPEPTAPPETEAPTEAPVQPVEVDESWFDDVLFIGNSLGVGLRDYAPLGEADYFCMIGQTVFNVLENWVYLKETGTTNLEQLLDEKTYGKIYIHLGTNECGYPVESILSAYQELVDWLREKQPDAAIVIQATITFGPYRYRLYSYMVPETITRLNENLKTLADEEHVYFIDFNPEVEDENGYLSMEFSLDGCHPTPDGYLLWSQWLLENAGELGIP